MIDARGDGSFDALQPPGEGVKHVSCACRPSKSSPRLVAQPNNTRARVRLSLTLQIRQWRSAEAGPAGSIPARDSRCDVHLASACRANAAAKQRPGEEGSRDRQKKKTRERKKQKRQTKGPSGDHPSCSTTPQHRPKEAIEDCPRAMIGGRDSTVRRRLQRH